MRSSSYGFRSCSPAVVSVQAIDNFKGLEKPRANDLLTHLAISLALGDTLLETSDRDKLGAELAFDAKDVALELRVCAASTGDK